MSRKLRTRLPSATSLVARSYPDRIIGIDNALPWHLGTDLKHFKLRTQGHAVVMGRRTFQSIGRPLPRRLNIVLSRQPIEDSELVRWAGDPETALLLADQFSIFNERKEFFVIGGEIIYKIFHRYINKVFLTDVFTGYINGDAKFDHDFDIKEWWPHSEKEFKKSENDDFAFRISCFIRRKPIHRYVSKQEFLQNYGSFEEHFERYSNLMSKADDDIMADERQMDFFSVL